jgi:FixJ family two-component response regulator
MTGEPARRPPDAADNLQHRTLPGRPGRLLTRPMRRTFHALEQRVSFDRQPGRPARADGTGDEIVYVVDDDVSVCRALARLFRSVGLAAQSFPSARDFLEHRLPSVPMCLVLDIRLPGLSGLDLQEALAKAGRDMPIVFITGHADVPSSVRAMKGGAVDFLQKPFNDQQLLDCVQHALAGSRARMLERAECDILQARFDTLTPRERDVLSHVITGRLNKQIASDLGIALKTIKVHRGRVMQKMGAASVADLVRMAQKLRLR